MKDPERESIEYADIEPIFHDDAEDTRLVGLEQKPKRRWAFREILPFIIILVAGLAVALFVHHFVLFNSTIPSSSMENTIQAGDSILSLRPAYWFTNPKRGDIVIFRHADENSKQAGDEIIMIKRVIGVPGDIIQIEDGVLFINGEYYEEDYLKEEMKGDFGPYVVPEDSYFMMGDHRNVSEDSRYWKERYVKRSQIIAKAWLRYSPSLGFI